MAHFFVCKNHRQTRTGVNNMEYYHGDGYLHNVLIVAEKVPDVQQAELIEKIQILVFGRLIQGSWRGVLR
jgi:hypothetical protein